MVDAKGGCLLFRGTGYNNLLDNLKVLAVFTVIPRGLFFHCILCSCHFCLNFGLYFLPCFWSSPRVVVLLYSKHLNVLMSGFYFTYCIIRKSKKFSY